MKKPNLLIASTPMQIINGIEAIEHFKLENTILVLVFRSRINEKNNNQLLEIAKLYNWKKTIKINKSLKKNKFYSYLKSIKEIKEIKKHEYNYVFFGIDSNISKLILANTKKNSLYLIDDGTATITIYKHVLQGNKFKKLKIRNLKYILFGLKIKIKDKVNIFTHFNLEKDKNYHVVKNNLNYFIKNSSYENSTEESIFFLGQPLVETNLISQKNYENYLEKIILKEDKKIYYIPHRFEEKEKLKKFQSEKFEILEIDMPIELYFISKKICPSEIISFFTTALYTLDKMYPNSKLQHIVIPAHFFLRRSKEYMKVYDSLNNETRSQNLHLDLEKTK